MAKKRINAKEAAADIRSGMDDDYLMKKYQLSPPGLQSLVDKLVGAGYLDLAEIEDRMPAFLGTVRITHPVLSTMKSEGHNSGPVLDGKSSSHVNAYEMARDIRSGMTDSALLRKFHLSSEELQSTFTKLIRLEMITRDDLDRSSDGIDNTVDLREDMLSVTRLMVLMGQPSSSVVGKATQPEPRKPEPLVKETPRHASRGDGDDGKPKAGRQDISNVDTVWYDCPLTTVLLLIGFFPLGFYALYRNSRLSGASKFGIVVAWALLLLVCLILASELFHWRPFSGFRTR